MTEQRAAVTDESDAQPGTVPQPRRKESPVGGAETGTGIECCSVAMPAAIQRALAVHLLRDDGQEDLTFALWSLSAGASRTTAMLHTVLLPAPGEREVHGNVSFSLAYFERALAAAAQAGCGLAFLHSHPARGWQDMSRDDVVAEQQRLAAATDSSTGYPLVGLTLGTDLAWSARFWPYVPQTNDVAARPRGGTYGKTACRFARSVSDSR